MSPTGRPTTRRASLRVRPLCARSVLALLLWTPLCVHPGNLPTGLDLTEPSRLRIGIGDRMRLERDGSWVRTLDEMERLGVRPDFVQIWLPHGWQESWLPRSDLDDMAQRGVVPVVVHYFFGDFISKERVEAQRAAWLRSIERMADRIRMAGPVLVVLEPEFNIAPPPGETAITRWPGFSSYLREAAQMIRSRAPNARVGVCVGDFAGPPYLEPVLGPVADDLDFLGFQEMRAATVPEAGSEAYLRVGRSATDFARYLERAFGRPLLLGYVAVSSHARWEEEQASALRDLLAHRRDLLDAGVFGWVYFQLFDDPRHTGFFAAAEPHFGLVTANGRPKPALDVFRELAR